MKKRILILSMFLIFCGIFQINALTLKLASLLPEGTEWNLALKSMAADWRDISDGKIKIRIYPGGIAGGESDVIRKMRIGQIDMAILSSVGITTINPDTFTMSIPFLLETEEELDFMLKEVSTEFEEDIRKEGFVVLAWSKSGWVTLFSKNKLITPDDMEQMKFAGSVTQPGISEAFKNMGFNVISIDTPDMTMGLQSGMVDSFYASTMVAASYQWFGLAPNMLNMKISPVIGGIIITERAWKKIPDSYKDELIEATEEMALKFYEESVVLEKEALRVMVDNGLIIHEASSTVRNDWKKLMGEDFSAMVGDNRIVPKESFETVQSMLEDFRSRQ